MKNGENIAMQWQQPLALPPRTLMRQLALAAGMAAQLISQWGNS